MVIQTGTKKNGTQQFFVPNLNSAGYEADSIAVWGGASVFLNRDRPLWIISNVDKELTGDPRKFDSGVMVVIVAPIFS